MKGRRPSPAVAPPQVAPVSSGPAPGLAGPAAAGPEGGGLGEAEVGNAEAQERLKAQGTAGAGAPPADAGGGSPTAPPGGGGGGVPGDLPFRAAMEKAFSQDFSTVKVVYSDPKAAALQARAFTQGNEIHFAAPKGKVDQKLVAHELTHIVQQRGGSATGSGVSSPGDASEGEARDIAGQVAAGQAAGPVQAAPSAGIHRDVDPTAKKDPNEGLTPEDKTAKEVAGYTFRVYPDAWKGTLPREAGPTVVPVLASGLGAAIAQKQAMRAVGDKICAAAWAESSQDWQTNMFRAMAGVSEAVLNDLYRDPAFLNHPVWGGNPKRLIEIARKLDPVQRFVDTVYMKQNQGSPLLTEVQKFAAASPADGLRALQSGPFQEKLDTLAPGPKVIAIQYLMNGGVLSDKPIDKLHRAMADGKKTDFWAVWPEVSKDPAQLEALKGDANFLTDVEAAFGAAELAAVQAFLLRPKSDDLSMEEQQKLDALLATACKNLSSELNATWSKDSIILDYLKSFFAQLEGLVPTGTDEQKAAAPGKKEKAKTQLKQAFQDYNGKSLEEAINRGMSGSELDQALALIAARKIEVAKAADPAAPKVYSNRLTPTEFDAVMAKLNGGTLKNLHDELTSMWTKDAKVLGFINDYEAWVLQNIKPEDAQIAESVAAAGKRQAEARKVLEEQYQTNYGTPFKVALAKGMDDEELKQANAFVDSGGREADPAEQEADTYGAEMSDKEQAKVDSEARKIASKLHDEIDAVVVTYDDVVLKILEEGRNNLHTDLKPPAKIAITGEIQKFWDAKTDRGMRRVKELYDAQYGSLVKGIHDTVSDASQRRALALIGDRSSANKTVIDAAGGDQQQKDDLDYKAQIEAFDVEITKLAEDLYNELEVTFPNYVSDANVNNVCARFGGLKTKYAKLASSQSFGPGGYLKMLEGAYLPLGGSLRRAISKGLDEDSQGTALKALGISPSEAGTVPRDAALESQKAGAATDEDKAKIEAKIVAKQKMTPLVATAAAALSTWNPKQRRADSFELQFNAIRNAAKPVEGSDYDALLRQTWKEVNGIDLVQQLGLLPAKNDEIAAFAGIQGPIAKSARTTVDEAAKTETKDLASQNPAFKFDPLKCMPGFSLDTAKERAIKLEKLLAARDVHMLNFELAGDGKKEENRVVLLMFTQLFKYDLKFRMREMLGTGDTFERMDQLSKTAGKNATFGGEIKDLVKGGSKEAVYKRIANATPQEQQELLQDTEAMYAIRQEFGEEAYDRIYRTLTHELTPGDLLRTRDTGKWYTLGIGTDKEGAKKDIEDLFKRMKRELLGKAKKNKGGDLTDDEKEGIDADLKNKALRMFADPDLQEMLNSEFSTDELLEMRQLLLGAGEQSGTDKARVAMEGVGTGSSILDDLKAMKDDERKKKRNDPTFVARLSDDLSGAKLQQALSILYADEGQEADADVHGATEDSWYGNVDEDKIFKTVTGLSHDELIKLANDPLRQATIRSKLDDKKDELQLFDEMMANAKALGPAQKSDGDGPMPDAEKLQRRKALVIKHTTAIKRGAYSGADDLMAAAQDAYKEKGEVEYGPKESKTKEELYGITERKAVAADAMTVVKAEYNEGAGWWTSIGADIIVVIEAAILGVSDPSGYRLDKGFSGSNNDDAIQGALKGASDETVLKDWSNILNEGEHTKSFKSVYDAYAADRTSVPAKHALVSFAFDISANLLHTLKQSGDWFTSTGDKELLDLKNTVRERIISLTGADAKGKKTVVKLLGATEEDASLIVGGDRGARSQFAHSKDDYKQQLEDGSMIDAFASSDEGMEVGYAQLAGEVGTATDSKKDGEVGQISEEDEEKINGKLEAFKVTIEEYRAAKNAVAEVMKWIAIAIITAVATALTGPGGPTLLLALMTAAASAGASAVIDEAIKGKDYEFVQEGLKKVVTDTAVAALTFGAGAWLEHAAKANSTIGKMASTIQRFQKWQEAIGKGASKSVGGAALAITWAGVTTAASGIGDSATASVDLSVWKYGFNQGMTFTDKNVSAAVEKMPADVGKAMLAQLVDSGMGAIRKEDEALEGVETGEAEDEPTDPTLLGSVGKGVKKSASGAKEALEDQAIETAMDKALGGNALKASGWDGDEVGDFMLEFGKGRVDDAIEGSGEAYQEQRNAKKLADRITQAAPIIAGLPDAEKAAALAYYKHYLEEKAKFTSGGLGMEPAAFVSGEWAKVKSAVDAQIAKSTATDQEKDAYRKFVYASPAQFEAHRAMTVDTYVKTSAKAKDTARDIRQSTEYGKLTDEQRSFYEVYLSDPNRLANFTNGKIEGIDVRDLGGTSTLLGSIAETKKKMVAAASAETVTKWPAGKQKAWEKHASSMGIPPLSPTDAAANKATVDGLVAAWSGQYDQATAPKTPATPPTNPLAKP